ncbi:VOC family protein [Cupriavidus sp. UYPR2.512]|uniref:VOC family protein n=1 Tax=Cupriavidus sp. UYPR2.512 TaxID=1080187 RepID=UPI0012F91F3B|nr:VOC family protein [Cupriavidus sp. UYPR2.512]UIF90004.1 VOC family protein [Cupriavidus necator]
MEDQATQTKALVKSVNHTSFTVTDLDRTIAFLCDGLGFRLLDKSPRDPAGIEKVVGIKGADMMIAFVQAPGHRIELIKYLGPEDRKVVVVRPCDTGFAHLALDVNDIDATIEVAAQYQVKPINDPVEVSHGPNAGLYCAYMRDPDGVTFEVIGPRLK